MTQFLAHAGPNRPLMDPASGFRRVKLRPHQMRDDLTATENLFVLAHIGIPRIGPAHWSLVSDGLVRRTRTLILEDLKTRPKKVVEAVHECCGNPLEPTVPTRRIGAARSRRAAG